MSIETETTLNVMKGLLIMYYMYLDDTQLYI